MIDLLLGLQWGDEGKGKIVDYLAPNYDIIARFQGGPNAGHTLIIGDQKIVLHTIPSGIMHEHTTNVIGNGVVIDPVILKAEIDEIKSLGIDLSNRLVISNRASLILPSHKMLDAASERAKGASKIGSTLRGIGPTYMDKTGRNALRAGDILSPNFKGKYEQLKKKHYDLLRLYNEQPDIEELESKWFESIDFMRTLNIESTEYTINKALHANKQILAEGAQGSMLDVDFGSYPFVTSSNTISSGACNGLGVSPKAINEIIGISKAYCTRVGSGPFPSELEDEKGEFLRKEGNEFGATTGRPRRCGWLDLPALKYAIMINGVTQIALTKVDVLNKFDAIQVAVSYQTGNGETTELPMNLEDTQGVNLKTFKGWNQNLEGLNSGNLPTALYQYIQYLESACKAPVTLISTGPERNELIVKETAISV